MHFTAKRGSLPAGKKVMRISVIDKVPGARLATTPMSHRTQQFPPAIKNPFFNYKPFKAPYHAHIPKENTADETS